MKKIKRLLATLMAVVMVITAAPLSGFVGLELPDLFNLFASAATYSGACGDNLTWTLNTSSGELVISGTGSMYTSSPSPWYTNRDSIKTINIADGVTNISHEAFKDCTKLNSVELPESVTSIDYGVFSGCTNLTSITIPDSVTEISNNAFDNTGYYNNTANWEDNVLYIGKHLIKANQEISGDYTIKDGTVTIAEYAFGYCYNIQNVAIPESVENINDNAFCGSSLESVSLPDSVSRIESYTFYNCAKLATVVIGDGVNYIENYAFYNCSNLRDLTMPISAKIENRSSSYYDDNMAFYNCNNIERITLTKGNGTSNNYGTSYSYGSNTCYTETPWYISGCTEIIIEDGVTAIGDYMFYNNSNLTIDLPNSIEYIGEYAFSYCYNLKSITIPESVKTIGDCAFFGSNQLEDITVSSGITSIGNNALYDTKYYMNTANWVNDGLYLGNYLIRVREALNGAFTVENGTELIADYAFSNCSNVKGVIIPDSVSYIGDYAFSSCYSLNNVNFLGNQEQWDSISIGEGNEVLNQYLNISYASGTCGDNLQWFLNTDGKLEIVGTGKMTNYSSTNVAPWDSYKDEIKSVSIYEGVTRIGNDSFVGCENLTYVYIPNTVTLIGNTAFRDCTSLASISIPNSVTNLGYYAFYGCTALTSITFPEGVTTIGNYAFGKCSGLATVIIPDTITTIAKNAFYKCTSLTNVYYAGTQEQWDAVTIDSTGNEAIIDNIILATTVTGSCGTNLNWYLINNEKLIISGNGAMTDYSSSSYAPWYGYASSIKKVIVEDGVTSIGDYAFYGCSNATEFVVPISIDYSSSYRAFYSCGDIQRVTLTKGNGTAKDYGERQNSSALISNGGTPWTQSSCVEIIIQDGVTEIGDFTFYGCGNIQNITIANSVKTIGSDAFSGCSGLTSVIIPDNTTSIGEYAFAECSNLSSVQIGKSVVFIEINAFSGSSIVDVYYTGSELDWISIDFKNYASNPMSVATGSLYINGSVVSGDIVIPDGTIRLNCYAFYGLNEVESVTIPEIVTYIYGGNSWPLRNSAIIYYKGTKSEWAAIEAPQGTIYNNGNVVFDSDSENPYIAGECGDNLDWTLHLDGNLTILGTGAMYDYSGSTKTPWNKHGFTTVTSISIEKGVTSIGGRAFYNCSSVDTIEIPDSVEHIGVGAFENMSEVTELVIPDSVTSIAEGAFKGMNNLQKITLPFVGSSIGSTSSSYYGYGVFGYIFGYSDYADEGTTYQYFYTSGYYEPYRYFYIPKTLRVVTITKESKLDNGAFHNCSFLTEINLSETITSIGQQAFENCSGLTELNIPDDVTSIGSNAFSGCSSLQVIEIPASVTSIGSYAFKDVSAVTEIVIPDSVISIGNGALKGMNNLESITLPFVGSSIDSSSGRECVFGYIFGTVSSDYIEKTQQNYYDNYGYSSSGYFGIPKTIKTVFITQDTTIPYGAFSGCSFISEINLPDNVTAIGEYAFYNCSGLAEISISDGVSNIGKHTFSGCSSLKSIELPESVNSIGEYAFDGCSSLTEIIIPDGVESIGRNTFYACASLEVIELPTSLKSIGYEAFAYTSIKEIVIPNSVTSIDGYILEGNSDIEKLTVPFLGSNRNSASTLNYLFDYSYDSDNSKVPKTLKKVNITNASKIGNNAFCDCSNIETITLNEGITSIGIYAFYQCSSLKEITIPDTVTNISDCAFNSCTAMKTVDLGNNPNLQINYNVFDDCDSVESYSIGSNSVNYCTDEYGVLYNKNKSGLIRYPTGNSRTEYIVDSNVAYINENAFENCIYLKTVDLPKDIISIGEYAFRNCTALKNVVIPEGTHAVCRGAFEGCTSVKEITIPESLAQLANNAFRDCTGVETIYYNASDLNPEEYKDYIFVNCGRETEGVDVIFGEAVVNIPDSLFEGKSEYYWSDTTEECSNCGATGSHSCRYDISPKIKSITIGSNVKNIGYNAFGNIGTLSDLYFNATNCDSANNAFNGCFTLTNVVIGENVIKLPSYFITNCDDVTDIVIPESVTEIGDFAFTNNDALETVRFNSTGEIIIGNDILQASYKAMICCKENSYMHSYAMMNGIKFAIVDDTDSPNFEIKNDVLISYKGNSEAVFISAASRIGYGAFKDNKTVKNIELSSGVDRVFGSAFAGCTNLEKIIIPKSVSAIGDGAFSGCDNLTIWCYAGSYAESYAISNNIPVEYITLNIEKKVVILNQDETTSVTVAFNTMIFDDVEITWTSSNPSVASVNSNGVITALSAGEATITATTSTGLYASCDVRVTGAGQVHGVALGFNVTLNKREEITITPNIDVDEGVLYTISYLSSDTSVATVDNDGKITAVSAGTATITCTVTDENGNAFDASIVVVVNNSADNFELSDDEVYISLGSTKQLTGIITPDNVVNKEIVWESTNPSIATVDANGNIKGVMAGTAVIVATTKDGGLKDYCIVKVVGVEALSTATIDHEKGIITGLSSNMNSLDSFIEISDPSCSVSYSTLGTESIIYIERGEEIVDAYTIVIFGDVNGDGWYDGQDAVLVSCLANGMLTKEDVSEVVYMAADCNHDGVIDESDVALLNQAGMLLANVDQSKPTEILLETSSAYVKYVSLIDQTSGIDAEEGATVPEVDVETEDGIDTPEQETIFNFIERFIDIIKALFEMIVRCIPVSLS